jgi:serine/threonine protein kinase
MMTLPTMDAAENVLRAGYRLDRYELLCPIASGGMATVWLARLRGKRGFEKLFAIKTIRTELVEDARFQEMFLDEARIASGIQHPDVAQILDLGEQEDVLFIVMEWVDGDSLAKIRKLVSKRGGKMPVGLALRILADACAGLHAAHELRDDAGEPRGIVHRDVSPQNILVSTSGAVKVIDFGIAKAQDRQQGETRTGVVKGKVQYMAPEQVHKGRTVDRRADIWALGVCLHEVVAGRPPNDGDDDVEVIRKLMSNEAPRVAEGLPEAIVRVLDRSMALDPDARFPTAAGMQRALEAAMKELGESSTSEDVAAFLRSELPELADKRRQLVSKAVEEARTRGGPATELSAAPREDVAFAPTVMSERLPPGRPTDGAKAIALTRRKDPASGARLLSSEAMDLEPIEIPKRSRAGLWALLMVVAGGAGAAFVWPGAARYVLGALGLASTTQPQPPAGIESASPPASLGPGAAPASAPSTHASADAPHASGTPPEPSASHAPRPGPAPAVEPPSSPPRVHLAWPTPSAAAPLAPLPPTPAASVAPAPPQEDPNNPYNN